MSESDSSSQEKTEEATPRRQEKAREEGQLARSKELNTAAILIAGTGSIYFTGMFLAKKMLLIFQDNFGVSGETLLDEQAMFSHLRVSATLAMEGVVPLFIILLVASIAGPMLLGGWNLSIKSLAPKLNRMSPLAGLKRMFSAKSLVELVKALAKFGLVATVTVLLLYSLQDHFMAMSYQSINRAILNSVTIVAWSSLALSLALIFIVAIDVPFQIWDHAQKMRMTKQEVKDEMKEVEGKPEVKGRMRQLQREIAQNRMMSAVPEADVVITNPTHYSVALKYDPATMDVPVVLAKGSDLIALKIREIANAHEVDIVEAPPLARAIYYTAEIDQVIPSGLYLAVAQVLAYVFQLQNYRDGVGDKPSPLQTPDLPDEYQFDP